MAGDKIEGRRISHDDVLLGFMDLCGSKQVYTTWPLKDQIARVENVVSKAWVELFNAFGKETESLYVHMFADSLVIAERRKFVSIDKLVHYFHSVQHKLMRCDPPILVRCMIRRGAYYGICFDQSQEINGLSMNLSLVGGPTVIQMDRELEGLPAGVYIDNSLALKMNDQSQLVPVEKDRLQFIKLPEHFHSFSALFDENETFDEWIDRLVRESNNDQEFIRKIRPWANAVQGRSKLVRYD